MDRRFELLPFNWLTCICFGMAFGPYANTVTTLNNQGMTTQKIALTNGQIYNGDDIFLGHALLIEDEHIQGIFPKQAVPDDYQLVDVQKGVICPGLIDLQIYGAGQDLFSADVSTAALSRIEQSLLAQGCTSFMLTLASNSDSVFKDAIRVFEQANPRVALGLHLEGPFLNEKKRGAHPAEFIVPATVEHIEHLLAEHTTAVKMMTVAPELLDESCAELLLQKNILLSAGHSAATFEQAASSLQHMRAVTHLWNAMSPLHHRDTGLPGAVFNHPTLAASIIVDGIHVDFEAVKISKQLLGDRLFLITDAVVPCEHGIYQHLFQHDRYALPDGTLSGSALTMLQAIRNCVEKVGIPLEEAIRMASSYPANLIERTDIGNLNNGSLANVLVFNENYEVQHVFFEGQQVGAV